MFSPDDRFRGFRQLVGPLAFERVANASVCVVGLGGVGSWVVEALARSAVGQLTIVDLDDVCVTNVNRQIHALTETVGAAKADVLAERVLSINPACKVAAVKCFLTENTSDSVLSSGFDLVIDTIDRVEHKALLLAECVKRRIAVVTVGSGGDRLDPQAAAVCDLARTIHDPLLQCTRKMLRQRYGFPKGERARFMIPCVYAPLQRGPAIHKEINNAELCNAPVTESGTRKSCNDGLGSAVFMTGTLGFMAAAEAIRILSNGRITEPYSWHKVSASPA